MNYRRNSCGCGCGTVTCSSDCTPSISNTAAIGTTVYVTNSWNIPATEGKAELDVPNVKTFQVGSYIMNPNYGKFKVTSFNASTGKLEIENPGFVFNALPGTIVGANTMFFTTYAAFQKVGTYTIAPVQQGSLGITLDATNYAEYKIQDDEAILDVAIEMTLSGSGNTIGINVPYAAKTGFNGPIPCQVINNTASRVLATAHFSTPTLILVRKQDLSNFTISVASELFISGRYPLAPQ